MSGGRTTTPSTWHCITTIAPSADSSHQRACRDRIAWSAAANAIADARGIRFGFQMNVEASMPAGETAISRPAASPAMGPATSRASHHTATTAPIPNSAISPVTTTGSAPERYAAGASR